MSGTAFTSARTVLLGWNKALPSARAEVLKSTPTTTPNSFASGREDFVRSALSLAVIYAGLTRACSALAHTLIRVRLTSVCIGLAVTRTRAQLFVHPSFTDTATHTLRAPSPRCRGSCLTSSSSGGGGDGYRREYPLSDVLLQHRVQAVQLQLQCTREVTKESRCKRESGVKGNGRGKL
jgi:hypothetical protein